MVSYYTQEDSGQTAVDKTEGGDDIVIMPGPLDLISFYSSLVKQEKQGHGWAKPNNPDGLPRLQLCAQSQVLVIVDPSMPSR